MLKLEGPAELLKTVKQIDLNSNKIPVVFENGEAFAGRMDEEGQVATLVMTPITPGLPESLGNGGESAWSDLAFDDDDDEWSEEEMDWVSENLGRKDQDLTDVGAQLNGSVNKALSNFLDDAKSIEYYKGLGAGFMGNPTDTAKDLWGFGKGAVKFLGKAAWNFSPFKVISTWRKRGQTRYCRAKMKHQ